MKKVLGLLVYDEETGEAEVLPPPPEYLEQAGPVSNDDPRLDTPLEELGLSTRTLNVLKAVGYSRVRDLVVIGQAEFLRIPNAGRMSLRETHRALTARGLRLGVVIV